MMRLLPGLLLLSVPLGAVDIYRSDGTVNSQSGEPYADTCTGLQIALNAAAADGAILRLELRAGALYSCGTASLRLPVHQYPGVVTIRSTGHRGLPDGRTRLCPAGSVLQRMSGCAANFASSGGAPGSSGGDLAIVEWAANFIAGIQGAPGVRDWRLIGLELRGTSNVLWSTLFGLDMQNGAAGTLADRARNIAIDRCWLHGYYDHYGPQKGIQADGQAIAIRNSVIEEIKAVGQDAQCIHTRSGPGPLTIINNFLSCGGENFMAGGAATQWAGSVPAWLTFLGNYSTRDARWWRTSAASDPPGTACTPGRYWKNSNTGNTWDCVDDGGGNGHWAGPPAPGGARPLDVYNVLKNVFELKAMKQALVEGNVFGDTWAQAQAGNILLLNLAAYAPYQNNYGYTAGNVLFRYNRIQNTISGLSIANGLGLTNYIRPFGFRIEHNLLDRTLQLERANRGPNQGYCSAPCLAAAFWPSGATFEPYGLLIRHNSVVRSDNASLTWNGTTFMPNGVYYSDAGPGKNFCPYCQLSDNILTWGNTAIAGAGSGNPNELLGWTGTYHWVGYGLAKGNIAALDGRNPSSTYRGYFTSPPCCGAPNANSIVNAMSDVLANPAAGDFHVKDPYRFTGTDGQDPGADIDTVHALTAGAPTGAPNPALGFRLGSAACTATGCTLYVEAPEGAAAPLIQASTSEDMSAPIAAAVRPGSGTAVIADLTGLASGTHYWYTVSFPAGGGNITRKAEFRTRVP